jgi:hypothetical protein
MMYLIRGRGSEALIGNTVDYGRMWKLAGSPMAGSMFLSSAAPKKSSDQSAVSIGLVPRQPGKCSLGLTVSHH